MAWQGRFDDIGQYGEGDKTGKSFKNLANTSQRQNQRFDTVSTSTKHEVPASEQIKRLCDIKADTISVTVTGIIIAKEPQRSFLSKKNIGSERHLISFIVRDSPSYFVNVTCWGGFEFIHHIATSFKVGDIVQIKSAQVQAKASNQSDEKFKPWTPVPFQLSVSENHGSIDSYAGWDIQSYRNFLTIPTRSSNNYYALEDINISGGTLQDQHVNILACSQKGYVGQVRFLTTKMGKQTKKCEIILFDKTCPAFSLDLWDHHVDTAFQWIPYDTVIFAADIKITYNNFKSSLVASADCKTIFTTNPDTREARCLRQFLRTQDAGMDIDFDLPMHDVDPDVNSINEVFTVQQVKMKQVALSRDSSTVPHYGVMFAVLTTFDIDG
ncbi:hypothetical protein C0Q70_01455 [Pomacea canaliculata]|uniref:MEIOB-like N-terminal domain-containing protein n=2 Tax=Pomacea canaliculata TaxID=400727 RepID=A0A2T7PZI8_POMCA|nr:hypothetical protein C0Q70_01455 [Pomacea canaliculata]